MSARIRTPRFAATVLTATALLAVGALADPAAAADRYDQTLLTPVLDAIYPQPGGLDDGYYTESERIYGIAGMGMAGGPYGEFAQPPNPDDAGMKGFRGWGVQGIVSDLTGVTPRPPGGRDSDYRPARASIGPVFLPFCDSPEPCPTGPAFDDRAPEPGSAETVLADRAAGADRALAEADWMSGLELRKTLTGKTPPPAARVAADEEAVEDLLDAATDVVDENEFLNETLMPVGDVLEAVDPAGVEEHDGEDEAFTAPAGQPDRAELTPPAPSKKKRPGKR